MVHANGGSEGGLVEKISKMPRSRGFMPLCGAVKAPLREKNQDLI